MESYKSYLNKKAKLEEELLQERRRIVHFVIVEIRECIESFELTPEDIFPNFGKISRKRKAKYFDPKTGRTWCGVGREPLWLRGRDWGEFLIDKPREEK
ncbi:H-NS histone family protein [Burkholderia sp. Bp9090]|uniref:H-NS histone family protein n=1 Tax=Burkholderia sp. Bp9090 TaxID=2184567 RepID=UPI000F5E2928|nr:H-NS histone family protein [Burkholderia sp. Bp9090]RQZ24329.1 H-NS histone family protein [Burkholderia sp. Bp9090]